MVLAYNIVADLGRSAHIRPDCYQGCRAIRNLRRRGSRLEGFRIATEAVWWIGQSI